MTNLRTSPPTSADTVDCPSCGAAIPLTQALASQLRAGLEAEFIDQMRRAEERVAADVERRVRLQSGLEIKDLRRQLDEATDARARAENSELELRSRERAVAAREESVQLELARLAKTLRADLSTELSAEHEVRIRELEAEKEDMRRQIDALRTRRPGSPQEQGLIRQSMLGERLARLFPGDEIDVVRRGAAGGDIVQTVRSSSGDPAGRILWENKAATRWANGWLKKLDVDRVRAHADLGVLVSTVPPPQGSGLHFVRDALLVVDVDSAYAVAALLRYQLLTAAHLVATLTRSSDVAGRVVEFVGSAAFVEPVCAIWAVFDAEQKALDAERRALTSCWEVRQDAKNKGVEAMARLLAGFQAAGAALPDKLRASLPGSTTRALPPKTEYPGPTE